MSARYEVKISDLEISRKMDNTDREDTILPDTLYWTAPELLQTKNARATKASDVYVDVENFSITYNVSGRIASFRIRYIF